MSANIKHKSLLGLHNREHSIEVAKPINDKYSNYLEELINLSTNVYGRCEKSMEKVEGTPASLIHLYFHILQMSDGIQVLCSNACFSSAIPLVRSLWEAFLSVEYMLENDFANRSSAWLACYHLGKKTYWESQDASTEKGQEIIKLKKEDKHFNSLDFGEKDPSIISSHVNRIDKLLSEPKFISALSGLKTKKGKLKKNWFSVNNVHEDIDVPESIKDLAGIMKQPLSYEYLYGSFSTFSHAKDASRAISIKNGKPVYAQIRNSSEGEMIYQLTCMYLVESTLLIAGKLQSSENVMDQVKDILVRHRANDLHS